MRLKYYLAIVCMLLTFSVFAQNVPDGPNTDSFCVILNQLLSDVSDGFVRAKGKETKVNSDTAIWASNISLLRAETSSLIFSNLWRYEGIMYRGISDYHVRIYYGRYKILLNDCLNDLIFTLTNEKKMVLKLENYPSLIYTTGQGKRITMEVAYAENSGVYTLAINVWQGEK